MNQDIVFKIRKFISRKVMVQSSDIMKKFNYRKPTTMAYLGKVGVLSSINLKGQYYILPEKHQFDENGLLFIGDVGFYEGGSLLNAICNLVEKSAAGMGARELDKILKTTTHSQLTGLFRKGVLTREAAPDRPGKAYIYFSADLEKATKQCEAYFNPRQDATEQKVTEIFPKELPDVIEVLLTLISHPDFSAKSVSMSLKRRGRNISRELVDRVFSKYLPGKKNC